jgi:hypothetical protein
MTLMGERSSMKLPLWHKKNPHSSKDKPLWWDNHMGEDPSGSKSKNLMGKRPIRKIQIPCVGKYYFPDPVVGKYNPL